LRKQGHGLAQRSFGETAKRLKRETEALAAKSDKIEELIGSTKDNMLCPLSGDQMQEPALAFDGHVYERSHIRKYLKA
jgi:hypothetical protein